MTTIGFIGIGNMGAPMAVNLLKAGYPVIVSDPNSEAVNRLMAEGATSASGLAQMADDADVLISMLPNGAIVRDVYLKALRDSLKTGQLLIDCSTIDVATAREVAAEVAGEGAVMLDAPVSGGVGGAEAGTLTFMCGGSDLAFARAKPFLDVMGKTIVHAGGAGNGQAAKICNNMMLGIQMLSVCEAFAMADRLGLDRQKLFDISSTASGQCWSLTTYCPVPGPVPASPANRDYQAGFTAAMMLKDLNLAAEAAKAGGASTQMGALALKLYDQFVDSGEGETDFSGIFRAVEAAGRSD